MYAIKLNDAFVDSNMNTWYEIKHGALCPEMSTQNKEKIAILNPNLFKYPSQEYQCILFKNAYASKSLAKSMRWGKAYSQRKWTRNRTKM